MVKIRLKDNYPGIHIELGMGNRLGRGEIGDFPESYELKHALDMGYVEAIKEEKIESKKAAEIMIFAEQRDNKISRVVFELLGKGRELADKLNAELSAVLLCDADKNSRELIYYGADRVYAAENPELKNYRTCPYSKVIVELIKEKKPDIFLLGATHIGRDLAPRISRRLSAGLTADCTGLDIDNDNGLLQTRPAFGGNIMAIIKSKNKPQMSTVRPGVMKMLQKDENRKGEVIKIKAEINKEDMKTNVVDIIKSAKKTAALEDAEIIVACGRGIGSKKNMKLIEDLANALNAEIGASRSLIDMGWMEPQRQIGQTGKTVRPKLYIACGISGAIQHQSGMKDSEMIVAINKDPNALIFKIADCCIVGDLNKVIPEIIGQLK